MELDWNDLIDDRISVIMQGIYNGQN